MLQKIRENSSGWIAKLILGLVIVVMAFFGFGDYIMPKTENFAAKVTVPGKFMGFGEKSKEVSVDDFRRRFDQTRQIERQQKGEAFDAAAFEKPENKRRILEQMIDEAVMQLGAEQSGVKISDAMVRDTILSIDGFKVDGKFDASRYQLALQQQGYTPKQFEQLVRQDLMTRFVVGEYIATGIASAAETDSLIRMSEQKRDLRYFDIPFPAVSQDATEAELNAWYGSHKTEYRTPETVAIEYVELDSTAASTDLVVDESVLKQRYDEQKAQYSSPEQRVASHILVAVPEGAPAAADAAAKAKAQAIAKNAQASPATFAEIAKSSDDTATKDIGGDLGPIEKGIYGDDFDKAFFALKPGQVSDPVRLPDGWHVLYYRELIAGSVKPFEEVRAEIEAGYLSSEKERVFNEIAGKMVNAVSENATSLEPAAKAINRPLLRTGAFTRTGGEGIAAIEAVRKAAFSEEVKNERRVSDLIELEPNHVLLIRVVDHKPESTLPLAQVKDQVRSALIQDRALKAAEKAAKALLDRLNKGETLEQLAASVGSSLVPVVGIPRKAQVPQLQPIHAEAFRLAKPANGKAGGAGIVKTPAGGYMLMQVDAVNEPDVKALDPAVRANAAKSIGQMRGDQQALEYVKALRKSFVVKVAEDRL
jgi:peptidyl-prolyl cis-trans isomerase D